MEKRGKGWKFSNFKKWPLLKSDYSYFLLFLMTVLTTYFLNLWLVVVGAFSEGAKVFKVLRSSSIFLHSQISVFFLYSIMFSHMAKNKFQVISLHTDGDIRCAACTPLIFNYK